MAEHGAVMAAWPRMVPSSVDLIAEWHLKFGYQVRTAPDASATDEDIEYRKALIDEEREELYEAMEARDVVAIADALADLRYVLDGLAVSLGIPLDAVMLEVHRSNMTKTYDPARAKYAGKVVVKGPDYVEPNIARALGLEAAA